MSFSFQFQFPVVEHECWKQKLETETGNWFFMKRALIHLAIVTLAGSMAVAQTNPPTPPPQPKAKTAPQAEDEAAPKAKAKSRTGTFTYHSAPGPANTYVYRTSAAGGSYLGVDVRDVTSDRVSALKLRNDQGVEITMVDQDSPAGKAGLKENDVVVSFNGKPVESAEQLKRLIRETKPGEAVALGIMRDGQSQNVNVTLGDRSKIYAKVAPRPMPLERYNRVIRIPDIEIPSVVMVQTSRRSGISVENLTEQLGEYFGVRSGGGVLVRSVEKGSKAEAAGLRPVT